MAQRTEPKAELPNRTRPAGTGQLGDLLSRMQCFMWCSPTLAKLRDSLFRFQIPRGQNLVCLPGLGVYSPISLLCPGKQSPGSQTWPLGLILSWLFSEKSEGNPWWPSRPSDVSPAGHFLEEGRREQGCPLTRKSPYRSVLSYKFSLKLHIVPFTVSLLPRFANLNFGSISAGMTPGIP